MLLHVNEILSAINQRINPYASLTLPELAAGRVYSPGQRVVFCVIIMPPSGITQLLTFSIEQLSLHPSPLTVFPSSHCSPVSSTPSPQIISGSAHASALHTLPYKGQLMLIAEGNMPLQYASCRVVSSLHASGYERSLVTLEAIMYELSFIMPLTNVPSGSSHGCIYEHW